MPGFLTNDLPTLPQVAQNMRIPVDTEFVRGVNPASVAATALQIAGALSEVNFGFPQTVAAGATTANWLGGTANTGALNTAPGATYTLTLTNSLITAAYLAAGGIPEVGIYSGGSANPNTGGGVPPMVNSALMVLQSVVPAVGSVAFTWMNMGATPLNGSMTIIWHL